MSTKKITSELRLAYWAQVMQERAESGLNVKTYCEKIGIKANTYFYWQTKLRKTISDQLTETNPLQLVSTGFVEVKKTKQPKNCNRFYRIMTSWYTLKSTAHVSA